MDIYDKMKKLSIEHMRGIDESEFDEEVIHLFQASLVNAIATIAATKNRQLAEIMHKHGLNYLDEGFKRMLVDSLGRKIQ